MYQDQPGEITEAERHELIIKAYKNLVSSFEKFKKPNGEKNYPAKTCKDLYAAYPDLESGIGLRFYQ